MRITTSTSLVDFQRDNVDAAIRYGRGQWQGLRADWLMADELFPVCSPSLLNGRKPLKCPEDLRDHVLLHTSNANSDDWRLWLTAAGLPADFSKQPGITFDLIFMTIQAAIDGIGVAMGRTSYVQDDIAKGRLVVPFKIALPADAGFYLVSPAGAGPIRRSLRRSGSGWSPQAHLRRPARPTKLEIFPADSARFCGLVAPRRLCQIAAEITCGRDLSPQHAQRGRTAWRQRARQEVPQIKSRIGAILARDRRQFS